VTTQHMHSEPDDVDTNAVSYPHAPAADAAEAFVVPEAEAPAHANGNSAEQPLADTSVPTAPAPEMTDTPTSQETPSVEIADEQPVRPFTEFIEEFRQSEARYQAAVQAYEEPLPASTGEGALSEAEAAPFADSPAPGDEASALKGAAVSPLLRPASRLRLPRHGSGRLREVAPLAPAVKDASATVAANGEPATTEAPSAPVEEASRPPRRYRFDRPSHAAPASGAAAATPEPRAESLSSAEVEVAPSPAAKAVTPPVRPGRYGRSAEPSAAGQPAAQQEAPAVPAPVEPESWQKLTSELPPMAAPVTEAAASEAGINPEDLPPLEYAELQKANTRRRRRSKHNGTAPVATGTAAPTPAVVPAPAPKTTAAPPAAAVPPASPVAPTSPIAVPRPAASPSAVTQGQYSIHSGYTMNQMNQNQGDGAGPFMPPEPSPARGSTLSQSNRAPRIERSSPVGRAAEGTHITISNLTNAITQAFQTQTDRMMAELRRANQTPTNITVSMPTLPSTERVGVFVDVANLLYSARTLRITVDFGKLLDFLRGNRRLVRAQAYCPTSPQLGDEQMFLQAVKGLGYRITTKNYKTFASGAKKADLDLDLCMDVVRLVDGRAVDSIVLVSGDSDFMPMLDYCSDHGVRVEVAAFDEAMSATLRQSCDLFVNLAMLEEIRA